MSIRFARGSGIITITNDQFCESSRCVLLAACASPVDSSEVMITTVNDDGGDSEDADDDNVYGPDEDLASRARRQREFFQKMDAWCEPGRIMRIHFPNPQHSSHLDHRKLVELLREDMRGKNPDPFRSQAKSVGSVWFTSDIEGGEEHVYHVLEMRPVDPLTALACMADKDDREEEKPTVGESGENR